MKRPLFDIGFSYLIASAVVLYCGKTAGYLLLTVAVVLAFILSPRSELPVYRRICVSLLACGAGVAITLGACWYFPWRYAVFDHANATITAVVTDRVSRHLFEVYGSIEDSDGYNVKTRMMVYAREAEALEPGQEFTAAVSSQLNSPFVDKERYSVGEKRLLFCYLEQSPISLEQSRYPLRSALAQGRYALHERLITLLGSQAGSLIGAITIGINTMDEEFKQQARDAGIYHVLAVSGLHISIFVELFQLLFPANLVKRRTINLLLLGVIWVPVLLSGMGYAVLRAALMYSVVYFGHLISRKGDSLNTLGFAVLTLLFWNPFATLSLAFILSVLATLGILLYERPLAFYLADKPILGWLGSYRQAAAHVLACSVSAQLFLWPILYILERRVVLNGLISSFFLLPLMTPLLGLGYILCLVLAAVPGAGIFGLSMGAAGGGYLGLISLFSHLPFCFTITSRAVVLLILVGYGVLLWLTVRGCTPHVAKTAAALGVILLCSTLLLEHFALRGVVRLVTVGSDMALLYGNHAAVLLAGNQTEEMQGELLHYQVQEVDFLFIDNFTPLESAAVAKLIQTIPVRHLFAPDTGSARSYLESVYDGEIFYGQQAQVFWYAGVQLDYQPQNRLEIAVGDILLLKFLSFYDIIDNRQVLLPPSGGVRLVKDVPGLQLRQASLQRSELLLYTGE